VLHIIAAVRRVLSTLHIIAAARLIIKMLHIIAAVRHVFNMPHSIAAVGHVLSLLHIMAAVRRHCMQLYWQRLYASITRRLRTVEMSMLFLQASLCMQYRNAPLCTNACSEAS
jgi:hypothetical protein